MKTVADKIKAAITLKGFSTMKECAQALALPYELFRKVVGENHLPKDEQLLIYAAKLGIDPKDLLFTAYHQKAPAEFKEYFSQKILREVATPKNKIPVLDWENLYNFNIAAQGANHLTNIKYLFTSLRNSRLFAIEVRGNSMNPLFLEDDVLIVDTDILPKPGDYVVVKNMKDKITSLNQLKRYQKIQILHYLNPSFEDFEVTKDIHIIGKVIRKQKDF
jgi:SOS-response transcriptional repressor LexA